MAARLGSVVKRCGFAGIFLAMLLGSLAWSDSAPAAGPHQTAIAIVSVQAASSLEVRGPMIEHPLDALTPDPAARGRTRSTRPR